MTRAEFIKIANIIGSTNLCHSGDLTVPRSDLDYVIPLVAEEVIQRNVIQSGPKKSDQVDLPELYDIIQKIIYIYHSKGWPIDDQLYALLHWTLDSGSTNRRSKQRDENSYTLSATIEATWFHQHKNSIPAAKLARSVGVSRTTIRRWRTETEYQQKTKIIITNDDFIVSINRLIK